MSPAPEGPDGGAETRSQPAAVFVMSTGRCATQFLAARLADVAPDCVVEHEPLKAGYRPRRVLANPERPYALLGRNAGIQRKFVEIEDVLASGRRYIDVGWPVFAWLPYLMQRFGRRLAFAHLVRDPFATAASLLTHGFFGGRNDAYARHAILQAGDQGVAFAQFAGRYPAFSPFEKCLYHWLEVNAFLIRFADRPAALGTFRYEDLFGDGGKTLGTLASALIGRPAPAIPVEPVDRHSHALRGEITVRDTELLDAVRGMAVNLGYSEAFLDAAANSSALQDRYSRRRRTSS